MPIGNSYMTAQEIAVSNTAFPAVSAPSISNDRPGTVSIAHLGTAGDPVVYVSFDGTTTAMILRAGLPTAAQSTEGKSYRYVWLRVASGTVNVYVNFEDAEASGV